MKYFQQSQNAFSTLVLILLFVLSLGAQTNENKKGDTLPPKKEGVKRIGVLLPKVSLNNVSKKVDPAIAVRNTFAALLDSDDIKIIPLKARLSALAFKEAQDKKCDYILKISLIQKKKKKGGFFNRIIDKTTDSVISDSTSKVPTGGTVGGSAGKEAIVEAGNSIAEVEIEIEKKDQFILDYEITTRATKSVKKNSIKVKAKKDNDKVLMPLIEKAANEIASFVLQGTLSKRPSRTSSFEVMESDIDPALPVIKTARSANAFRVQALACSSLIVWTS